MKRTNILNEQGVLRIEWLEEEAEVAGSKPYGQAVRKCSAIWPI